MREIRKHILSGFQKVIEGFSNQFKAIINRNYDGLNELTLKT